MSRRRHITFEAQPPEAPSAVAEINPLRFAVPLVGQREHTVDFTGLPTTPLVREMVGLLRRYLLGRSYSTADGFGGYVRSVREFLSYLSPSVPSVDQISKQALDEYAGHVSRHFAKATADDLMSVPLRLLREFGQDRFRPDAWDRLHYSFAHQKPARSTPRDAYSGHVLLQVVRGCRRLMRESIRRLTVEADAILANASDPTVIPRVRFNINGFTYPGWKPWQNAVWDVAHRGPLTISNIEERSGGGGPRLAEQWGKRGFRGVNAAVFPTPEDLFPFLVFFLYRSGIPVAASLDLESDCLRNERGDYADIRYLKRRGGNLWIEETFRARGSTSPGGVVKTILAITRRLRAHCLDDGHPTKRLWITYAQYGNRTNGDDAPDGHSNICSAGLNEWFCRTIGLVDDNGQPMRTLQLSRLRKSHEAAWEKATEGQIGELSRSHTAKVAIQHYGDIPALRPLHEQTVADGLQDAFESMLDVRSTVLNEEEEAEILADPEAGAKRLSIPTPALKGIVGGESDVFFAACKDFRNSPFGEPGHPCPVAAWGCLDCSNAVITARKLPEIYALLNHMEGEREVLSPDDWAERYGTGHRKIVKGILPRFSETVRAEARMLAAAQEDLIYLPPEFYHRGDQA